MTTTGPSFIYRLKGGEITHAEFTPEDFGVSRATLADLAGGDSAANAFDIVTESHIVTIGEVPTPTPTMAVSVTASATSAPETGEPTETLEPTPTQWFPPTQTPTPTSTATSTATATPSA